MAIKLVSRATDGFLDDEGIPVEFSKIRETGSFNGNSMRDEQMSIETEAQGGKMYFHDTSTGRVTAYAPI